MIKEIIIKTSQYADGQTQRGCIKKEDASSSTVITEAVFLTCIDAKQGRLVAMVNLPGALLYTNNVDDAVMFMRGRLADLLAMVAPQTY